MRLLKKLLPAVIIYPLLFSCNNSTIASKPPVETFAYRAISDSEKVVYSEKFSRFFDSLLLRQGFSGGILVAKNGQVLYENYTGFSDAGKTLPVSDTTPFHIASTSKTFTSTAVLQLVQAGKINLDDSLGKFFPEFPYPGNTVRSLLSHSSGIPNYANFMEFYGWDRRVPATNADVLYSLYTNRPVREFSPGSRFRYCNTNFVLLALLVEKVSGRFFPDYVRDSIFTPCGMSNSYIVSTKTADRFLPSFSGNRYFGFDFLDGIYGDKNVFSTCRDLYRYDSCIRENVILRQAMYDQAWTPSYPDRHYRDTTEFYGLGWRLKIFPENLKIPYHNGWWHGNNSVFQRVIADTAVIIVTGNRFTTRIYQAAKAANIFRPYYSRRDIAEEVPPTELQANEETNRRKTAVSSSKKRTSKAKKPAAKKPATKKRKR